MIISYVRAQSLIAQISELIRAVFPLGPGNYRLQISDPLKMESEKDRQKKAFARASAFQKTADAKALHVLSKDKNLLYVLERLGKSLQVGAGFCDEYATLALAYLYACCQNKDERSCISMARFYQPKYGCFGNTDHVFIIINKFDPKKPLKDQSDDVYIYDPWLGPNVLFRANAADAVWLDPKFEEARKAIHQKEVRGGYSIEDYKEDLKEYYQSFRLAETQWPDSWKEDKPIKLLPISEYFIRTMDLNYDNLVEKISSGMLLPGAPQPTDDDEEERIALEDRSRLRTQQGTVIDPEKASSSGLDTTFSSGDDEEERVALEKRRLNNMS